MTSALRGPRGDIAAAGFEETACSLFDVASVGRLGSCSAAGALQARPDRCGKCERTYDLPLNHL